MTELQTLQRDLEDLRGILLHYIDEHKRLERRVWVTEGTCQQVELAWDNPSDKNINIYNNKGGGRSVRRVVTE